MTANLCFPILCTPLAWLQAFADGQDQAKTDTPLDGPIVSWLGVPLLVRLLGGPPHSVVWSTFGQDLHGVWGRGRRKGVVLAEEPHGDPSRTREDPPSRIRPRPVQGPAPKPACGHGIRARKISSLYRIISSAFEKSLARFTLAEEGYVAPVVSRLCHDGARCNAITCFHRRP